MHRLVLEDAEHRLCAVEQRVARFLERGALERADHLLIGLGRERADGITRGPTRLWVAGGRLRKGHRRLGMALMRIDAAREEGLEPAVDAGPSEPLLHQRIEAEPREVSLVEDDRVAQRDRLTVVGVVGDHVEDGARPLAIPAIPPHDGVTVESG